MTAGAVREEHAWCRQHTWPAMAVWVEVLIERAIQPPVGLQQPGTAAAVGTTWADVRCLEAGWVSLVEELHSMALQQRASRAVM